MHVHNKTEPKAHPGSIYVMTPLLGHFLRNIQKRFLNISIRSTAKVTLPMGTLEASSRQIRMLQTTVSAASSVN